jgi:pilus assembly protein CpaB
MTRRRLLTIALAVLLTLFGTVILIAYISSAEQRARQGQELTTVLVPTAEIEANVPARDLADRVTSEEVPRDMRPEDAVSGLDELRDRVTAVTLLPGEPLRAGRFQAPGRTRTPGGMAIPEGMQVVSVALEPQRALGGRLQEGQLVGVMLSVDQAEVPSPDDPGETDVADTATGMVLNRVLVTNVVGAINEETGQVDGTVMVSFALDESDAERLVFGAEHGRIWLTEQNDDTPTLENQFRTRQNIFQDVVVDTEG